MKQQQPGAGGRTVRMRDISVASVLSNVSSTLGPTIDKKPLGLKQRTSSWTDRRDFTGNTWIASLPLLKFREYLVPVNHFSIWRRHNTWAIEDGKILRTYVGDRYASNMVFMSLLLSTQCGVLFNSSSVCNAVRDDLVAANWGTASFWAGLFIILSAIFTILSLISTFTFLAMISAIDENNAHCILRSSIGVFATELPGSLIVGSIYTFLVSFMSFFFILLPVGAFSFLILLLTAFLFVLVVSVFSAFGRIIMHTGAMGEGRIFSPEYEELLMPESLHFNLLKKARCNLANNTSIIRQYKHRQRPIDRFIHEDNLYDHLSGRNRMQVVHDYHETSSFAEDLDDFEPRKGSKVRFESSNDNDGGGGLPAGMTPRTGAGTWSTSADVHREQSATDIEEAFESIASGTAAAPLLPKSGSGDSISISINGDAIANGNANQTTIREANARSLTPLSDLSDGLLSSRDRFHQQHQQQRSNSPEPPPRRFFSAKAPRDASRLNELSLHRWLRGAPRPSPASAAAAPTTNRGFASSSEPALARGNTNHEEKKDTEVPPPSVRAVPSPSVAMVSKQNDNRGRFTPTATDAAAMTPFSDEESRRSQREMSEDDRFFFDYGSFDDDNDETAPGDGEPATPIVSNNANRGYGTHVAPADHATDPSPRHCDAGAHDPATGPPEDERTRLLRR